MKLREVKKAEVLGGRNTMNNEQKSAKSFKDLIVWQKAHAFVLEIYSYTKLFPKEEIYGLSSQFRRAAVSIPANISEGFKKLGTKDKLRYYNIAQGSLEECRYYLILAKDLGYGDSKKQMIILIELSRLLNSYAQTIQKSIKG